MTMEFGQEVSLIAQAALARARLDGCCCCKASRLLSTMFYKLPIHVVAGLTIGLELKTCVVESCGQLAPGSAFHLPREGDPEELWSIFAFWG